MNRTSSKAIFSKIARCALKVIGVLMITVQISFANEIIFDNKSIPYTDTGSGKPMVLIYAYNSPSETEKAQKEDIERFAKRVRVITIDVSKLEQSTPTGDKTFSLDQSVEAVNAVLVHLHIEFALLSGKSRGASIAMEFAQKYPDKTAGVALEVR